MLFAILADLLFSNRWGIELKIEPRNILIAPTSKEIADLEAVLEVTLPKEYVDLVVNMNGAYVQENIFYIPGGGNAGVSQFVPFDKVAYEKSLIEQTGPKKYVPIAYASGGNYVCLSIKKSDFGAIYFFDHEIPGMAALAKLATSLVKFFDLLSPFSVADVKIDPDDMGEVWVDPDFMRQIKGG